MSNFSSFAQPHIIGMQPTLSSRLQKLPRELRERVYFHLGIPVAGYCLHKCDMLCEAFSTWYTHSLDSPLVVETPRPPLPSSHTIETEPRKFEAKERVITVKFACPHHGRGNRPLRVEGIDQDPRAKVNLFVHEPTPHHLC